MYGITACLLAIALLSIASSAQAPSRPLDINQIRVPASFRVSIFARMPSAPRFMVFGPSGNLLVSLMNTGRIASVSPDGQVGTFAQGLAQPHGLAVFGDDLFVAEQRQVRVYRNMEPARSEVLVSGIPAGGHSTRTIIFGPDGKMYVSIGSSCNLCNETDERRAAVVRYNPDGTGQEIFARGLRNSVGLRWHPVTGELWATDNGFDNFGDDRPPEEINIVRQGAHYGWPFCWADRLSNPTFPNPDPAFCQNTAGAAVQMQAHSAPLGFGFYTGTRFPAEYHGDAFVAFHGSWNRSVPTGYKIVRVRASDGRAGAVEDFATGWFDGQTASGRPVDVLTGPDGALYVSDDRANIIYRIAYEGASLNSGGVTNAASYSPSVAVAPGGLISIFGQGLFSG
ncbi:MAG: PQQ-dependent sugar dehydrogenase, partial [Gammaproteobacteria bacterium]